LKLRHTSPKPEIARSSTPFAQSPAFSSQVTQRVA
jgi:hypothetical protein